MRLFRVPGSQNLMRYKSIHSRLHHMCTRVARQGKQASVCFALALTLGAGLASCAGAPSPDIALSAPDTTGATDAAETQTGSTLATNDATPQNVDCKRLTGRMQIRILQIRNHATDSQTSELSRGLQGLFGGSSGGQKPVSGYQRDVAELNAQNKSLASQGCKTFDLDKELQAQSFTQTPTPR